jgi:hypothetical protein
MQKSIHKLTVGKEKAGLDLYCSLKMDGKEVQRFRSRSFLGSFAWMLQALMHGGRDRKLAHTSCASNASASSMDNNHLKYSTAYTIDASNGQTPLEIDAGWNKIWENFADKDSEFPNYVVITGTENLNGIYRGVKTGDTKCELYNLDGSPVDGSVGSAVGGYCMPTIGYVNHPIRSYRDEDYFALDSIQNWQVIVGKSDKAVNVEDVYLWDRIMHGSGEGLLNHGNVSISSLTTDKPTSRFTISKPFTNNGATTIEVSEIGVLAGIIRQTDSESQQGDSQGMLMVRDTLDSPLSIPTGKTLTVDYELVVRLTPDTQDTDADGTNGGFTQEFMNRLRFLSGEANNIRQQYLACATSIGKADYSYSVLREWPSESLGIRLGDDNQFTSMTDEKLSLNDAGRNGYEHGDADGQIYQYANDVGLVEYDLINNKALFTISRIFENKGSVPIEVKEIGLFGNISTDSSGPAVPALIARTALAPADQFTIQPGEFRQVQYVVEVIA